MHSFKKNFTSPWSTGQRKSYSQDERKEQDAPTRQHVFNSQPNPWSKKTTTQSSWSSQKRPISWSVGRKERESGHSLDAWKARGPQKEEEGETPQYRDQDLDIIRSYLGEVAYERDFNRDDWRNNESEMSFEQESDNEEDYDFHFSNLDFPLMIEEEEEFEEEEDKRLKSYYEEFRNQRNYVAIPKHKGEVGRILDQEVIRGLTEDVARYQIELAQNLVEGENPLFEIQEATNPELVETIMQLQVAEMCNEEKQRVDDLLENESQECLKFALNMDEKLRAWEERKLRGGEEE